MGAQLRRAAAVLLLRERRQSTGIEVFMVKRSSQNMFMPDMYVFPGGSVIDEDGQAEMLPGLCTPIVQTDAVTDPERRTSLGTGTRTAAIRELFEEANVLLAYHHNSLLTINDVNRNYYAAQRKVIYTTTSSLQILAKSADLVLATDQLHYYSHWITPEGLPKRFDTHFFVAPTPQGQEARYEDGEASEGLWIQPELAIKRFEEREFPIAFPTFHQLRNLITFTTVQEVLEGIATRYVPTCQPKIIEQADKKYAYLQEDPDNIWLL